MNSESEASQLSRVVISEVQTRQDRDAFIKFPWRIYKNDPAWVPPLLIERKGFLDRKRHPFYRHGDAALFLARRDGEIVGRIMASDDPNYNSLHGSNVGCFGLFECIDNREVAAALFAAVADWLRGRGRSEVMGPIDYSTNYMCGLLVHGFEHPPTVLTSHNPPYCAALIEACGFHKVKDFYAWWFSESAKPAERLQKLASAMKKRSRVQTRPVNLKNWYAETELVRGIYNQAWEKNWGFVPFTESEFKFMADELKPIVVADGAQIAEIDNQPVGFILGVPDINVALKRINGRLTRFGLPIGLLRLLYLKNRIRTGRLIALGVLPQYRRAGVAELLVLRMIEEATFKRAFTGELSMTLEDNIMINRFLEAIGAVKYKIYRIYERSLDSVTAS